MSIAWERKTIQEQSLPDCISIYLKKEKLLLQFIFQWDTDSVYKYKYYVCNVGNDMMTIGKMKVKQMENREKKLIKREEKWKIDDEERQQRNFNCR